MSQKVTLSIIGCGARGDTTYGALAATLFKDRCQVVAVADPNAERRAICAKRCGVAPDHCFTSGDELLAQPKLSDALILATMDQQHVAYAIAALKKGYDILLEKPISPSIKECLALEDEYQKHQHNVVVCHVLRYNYFYGRIKSLIDSGKLGRIVNVEASENVGYWHMAHSFVRGNWRNSELSSPMILQKSCHDMDIFVWLFSSRCKRLSSIGSLDEFKPEMAPKGATLRCLDCPLKDCIFDARKIYLTNTATGFDHGDRGWPIVPYLTSVPTRENVLKALRDGPYGRCVYHCDNDVVDHQTTLIELENGVVISFSMSAFAQAPHRSIKILGTLGSLTGDDNLSALTFHDFKTESTEEIPVDPEAHSQGHGGGDVGLFEDFLDVEEGKPRPSNLTTLPVSLESHYMCFAAEASRLHNGELIDIADFKAKNH